MPITYYPTFKNSSGNVGIGNINPGFRLDIKALTTNGSTVFVIRNANDANNTVFYDNGTVSAGSDFRAPIFYDTNNTSYYIDAASTSVINALSVSTLNNINAANGTWHTSAEGKARFYFASNGTTYFRTGNDYVFRNNSDSGVVVIDSSGNLRTTTGGDNSPSYSLHVGGTGFASTDFRAPIFYDSGNTAYYVDPASTSNLNGLTVAGGNATIYRDLIVNGGASNPYGNRIIVQGTATTYTLQDSLLRPTIYLNGEYPVLTLNNTATTNSNHGPTIQFAFNGLTTGGSTSRQIVIGANGVGSWLDFGFSGGGYGTNSDYNPHNGISGYSGTTTMRIFSNGVLIGSTGAYPNNITSTSYALDVRGTGYSNTDFRSPIYYDSDNTGYYINAAGASSLNTLTMAGIITTVSSGTAINFSGQSDSFGYNATSGQGTYIKGTGSTYIYGGGVFFDGSAIRTLLHSNNYSGYSAFSGSVSSGGNITATGYIYTSTYLQTGNNNIYPNGYANTLSINIGNSANNNWVSGISIAPGGLVTMFGDARAPIFYDSGNTAYYIDAASTSNLNALIVAASTRIGGAASRSTSGLTVGFTDNSTFAANTDVGDTDRMLSIVNESSTTNAMAVLGFRVNPNGGTTNAMLDMKYVQTGATNTSGLHYTFNHGGSFLDRFSILSSGNVGIGAIAPDTNLQVVGHVHVGNQTTFENTGGWNKTIYLDGAVHARMRILGSAFASGKNSATETSIWVDNSVAPYSGLDTNAGSFRINAGFTTMLNSARSPIFYDSDNTAYYIDAASTSVLNAFTGSHSGGSVNVTSVNGAYIGVNNTTNTNGYGISLYNGASAGEPTYGLMFQGTGTFGTHGSVTGDWATYFTMNNDNSRGWIFRKTGGGGNTASISAGGIITASGDIRAPIFYDSNDTNYYVDPASTTRLNNLTVIGTMTFGTLAYTTESRRSKNSSNVDIETVTGLVSPSGPTFLEIRGFCPPTMYRTTGDRPAPYGLGFGNGSESGGIMPIGAGDNLQEIMLYGANSGPTTFTFKRQIWEGNAQDPSFSNYYGSSVFSINTGTGAVTASTDIRSPIYYDQNNTAYYIDAASTSNLVGLTVANTITGSITGNAGGSSASCTGNAATATILQTARNINGTSFNGSAAITTATWGTARTITIGSTGKSVDGSANVSWSLAELGAAATNQTMFIGTTSVAINRSSASQTLTGVSIDGNSATTTLATKATRANGNFYIDDNYGNTVVGLYSANRYQGVFAMGDAYKLAADGTTTGSLYGIAWSHPNAGGAAGNLSTHGALILENGSYIAAISSSIRCTADMRTPIYYDSNDTAYYLNPNGSSSLVDVTANEFYARNWFRNNDSGEGIYNQTTTQHFYTDDVSYWNVASSSGAQGIRFRTGGHGGTIRGYVYANDSNDVGLLNNGGSWRLRIVGGDYLLADGSSIRGQIFYDTNDTAYYCDPAGTTNLSTLSIAATLQFGGNINWNHGVTTELGRKTIGFNIWQGGKKLNADEDFNSGNNNISVYNNSGGTALTITRTALATAPNSSGQVLRVAYTPGSSGTSPGFGGFFFATQTAANKVFVTRFVANIPTGRSLAFHSNSFGTNTNSYWLTNNVGTGKWEEYVYVVMCGNTGTFSSTNFFAISGGSDVAFTWDIASATVFDITNKYESVSRVYTADLQMVAPIFYDQNNTSYFIDPASTSNLVGLTVANTITGSVSGNAATATTLQTARNINGTSFNGSAAITTATWGTARTITIGSTGKSVDGSANVSWSLAELGAAATNQTMFIGTTSVAINRSSASQTLTGISIDGNAATVTAGVYTNTGNTLTGTNLFQSNLGTTSGSLSSPPLQAYATGTNAAFMSFHRGGSYAVNMGLDSDNVLRIGGWSASANRWQLDMSGNQYLAASCRATIFYDIDNTGYYLDPNSTTSLRTVGSWRSDASTWDGEFSGKIQYHANHWYIQAADLLIYRNSGGSNVFTVNQSGVAIASADMRAPIFYDNNDTGYYLDPNSTSNLLLVRTRNTFGERVAVSATASTTINTQYNVTELTLAATITTLTLSNIQASGIVHMWTIITVGGGVGYSITWPAAVKWPGGTAPTLTTASSKRDIYQFVTYDGGTNIYAIIVGQNL